MSAIRSPRKKTLIYLAKNLRVTIGEISKINFRVIAKRSINDPFSIRRNLKSIQRRWRIERYLNRNIAAD
jgi:hypothetical protein